VDGVGLVFGVAWVYGVDQVYWDAQVFGGKWEVSPLQIQGTRYLFSVSSPDTIRVGCADKTVGEWLESCEREFEERGFTERERLEYKLYFNLAAELYGWDVPLFQVGAKEETA
jgi:hypothetical protein